MLMIEIWLIRFCCVKFGMGVLLLFRFLIGGRVNFGVGLFMSVDGILLGLLLSVN